MGHLFHGHARGIACVSAGFAGLCHRKQAKFTMVFYQSLTPVMSTLSSKVVLYEACQPAPYCVGFMQFPTAFVFHIM